jgi:photosystem II stability/assembly factor-like uncharacterized protein
LVLIFSCYSTYDGINVITVGSGGKIFYSNSSASRWYSSSSGTSTTIYCLSHSYSLKAMVGGANSYVAKTSDGGKTWSTMSVFSNSVTIRFHSISLLSDIEAFVAGSDGIIYSTTNFGSSWARIASTGAMLYSISAYDSATVIAGAVSSSGIYVMLPGMH